MKRITITLIAVAAALASCPLFGQETGIQTTTVKDLVEVHEKGWFRVQGEFTKTYDKSRLLFSIKDQDYIIPVRLAKKDLGAEDRFESLNLQKGDTLIVKGRLTYLEAAPGEYYRGLADAVIIEKKEARHEEAADQLPVIMDPETKPSFNGGDANEFSKWVYNHLEYPQKARENGIRGRVIISFTVEKDGTVTNVNVLKGADPDLDNEAVRVVSSSPKWKPGAVNGEPVAVKYTFPVVF